MARRFVRGVLYETLNRADVSTQINSMLKHFISDRRNDIFKHFNPPVNEKWDINKSYVEFIFRGEASVEFLHKNYLINNLYTELPMDMLGILNGVLDVVCDDSNIVYSLFFEYKVHMMNGNGEHFTTIYDYWVNGDAFRVQNG